MRFAELIKLCESYEDKADLDETDNAEDIEPQPIKKFDKEEGLWVTTQKTGKFSSTTYYSKDEGCKTLHRTKGPAFYGQSYSEEPYGGLDVEYFFNGKQYREEDWKQIVSHTSPEDQQHAADLIDSLDDDPHGFNDQPPWIDEDRYPDSRNQ